MVLYAHKGASGSMVSLRVDSRISKILPSITPEKAASDTVGPPALPQATPRETM